MSSRPSQERPSSHNAGGGWFAGPSTRCRWTASVPATPAIGYRVSAPGGRGRAVGSSLSIGPLRASESIVGRNGAAAGRRRLCWLLLHIQSKHFRDDLPERDEIDLARRGAPPGEPDGAAGL